jgi:hypothetical protein
MNEPLSPDPRPPQPIRRFLKQHGPILTGIPFGLLYGALARMAFNGTLLGERFVTLTYAFLFLAPVAIGALTIWLARGPGRTSWMTAFFLPWLATGIGGLTTAVLAYEALICVVMALPILLPMSSLGGTIMAAVLRRRTERDQTTLLGIFLIAPFWVAPIEHQVPVQTATATVETSIVIEADAATVWANLVEVALIQEEERSFSPVFDLFGAPRPLAATLDRAGVGGIRRGLFEDGLAFVETITVWEPARRIVWSIGADTSQVTRAPWQEIGGRYFDVTAASYQLEPLGPDRVILHLSSTHRLSTRFNPYGLLWTRWGLAEFQRQVLQILKARAEAASA